LEQEITQTVTGGTARGYVASYDSETKVLKYFQDRSLYFGNSLDQTDRTDHSKVYNFESLEDQLLHLQDLLILILEFQQ
jgi:hypothetical protein